MPLAIIWCRAPGVSILDLRGIQFENHYLIFTSTDNLMYVPNFLESCFGSVIIHPCIGIHLTLSQGFVTQGIETGQHIDNTASDIDHTDGYKIRESGKENSGKHKRHIP